MNNTETTQKHEITRDAIRDLVKENPFVTRDTIRRVLKDTENINWEQSELDAFMDQMIIEQTKQSFTEFKNVRSNDTIHMDRFMLLITNHRRIKSVTCTAKAPNGRRYSVKFIQPNTNVATVWFGLDHEQKHVVYGAEKLVNSVIPFDHLDRMADRRANTITWLSGEFPDDRASQLQNELITKGTITFNKLEITPDRLYVFHSHGATAKIGNRDIHGKIAKITQTNRVTFTDSDNPSPRRSEIQIQQIGVESTLFHVWNELNQITIKHV